MVYPRPSRASTRAIRKSPNDDDPFHRRHLRDVCEYEPPTARLTSASLGHSTGAMANPKAKE
jgi:hypothetical protein